ncbi:RND transporter, HAE1/HME family, permease protein [Paraprevotella xylaniphila YIT 11841]|uniref:RND transporter, HAE1/HME family, permease protein n=1 Tax=Paraprevotella xylaniphila YIT 11841 TaxID=762982 RepID=F3QXY3_9BACT|nr:efflux RND transporter permease subunit [Paraprevotella xylaniphila]EGG51017.1 RND transporter, HAE1/HME family, permease protein [Paraprevotella xylaniphila YIT 11841]
MIVRNLIHRPIAVTMCLIALIAIGCISFKYIPVSLMPDIDIPQITVQVSYPGASVHEVDAEVVAPLRSQLMQVAGLKDIHSESRMDAGSIFMEFEPGSNIDLIFIEVNEKIDRAMNRMPKELERPKVVKASAMDIPAFYLDLSLKNEGVGKDGSLPKAGMKFTQLGEFARNIVSKRIEQLPQTAMVDISGTTGAEIICIPDEAKLLSMGLDMETLSKAIQSNNITLGALSVVDGLYRYNIHFDSQLLNREDIENVYINHEGRLVQLKDLCRVEEKLASRVGLVRHDGKNAVTMAVIKQNDAQMEDLQKSIGALVEDLRKEYPDISFDLTRDQTRLLTYSIDNLGQNLYVGAVLACLVLFLFMKDWRLPLLIIITIPLTLIVTLLSFHLLGISLNIISLSGLILGVGMIVDNSIIVIDNVMQRWRQGMPLADALVKGTNEVFTPMLSSVLTTCSVFVPLIFLSGIAGALFYDQAMGVTIALFASLFVAVLVIPVYFMVLYRKRKTCPEGEVLDRKFHFNFYTPYECGVKWVLRNPVKSVTAFCLAIPAIFLIYKGLEKERLPYMEHNDALMKIDWNAGISVEENDARVGDVLKQVDGMVQTSTAMVGVQDFVLSHTEDLTTSEAVVYFQAEDGETLRQAQEKMRNYMAERYPHGTVEFGVSGNIFDLIFSNDDADLEIRLQRQGGGRPDVHEARAFLDTLSRRFPEVAVQPVVSERNIQYVADTEQMAVYHVSYAALQARLRMLVSQNEVYAINEGARSLPVIIGERGMDSRRLLQYTVRNDEGVDIPLSYLIRETQGEDFKRLYSGNGGDYYPVKIAANDRTVESIVDFTERFVKADPHYSASFTGNYYSSREMIGELVLVLSVAVALLYFILAAQFESIVQPLVILSEIVIDVFWVFLVLWLLGESLNIMSMIGIVVMSGIIINDSILKVDTMNRLRREGMPLVTAIWRGGHSRLRPIVMTSLTTILAILPFLSRGDMGSALQYPLSLTLIVGMVAGTLVSLFFIPLVYYLIYRKRG